MAEIDWYRERNLLVAVGFDAAVNDAVAILLRNPRAGAVSRLVAKRLGVRRWVMSHYPYSVFYRVADGEILVVAVAHAKRRPGYWRHRMLGG